MDCYLTVPSHYLSQCGFIISNVRNISTKDNLPRQWNLESPSKHIWWIFFRENHNISMWTSESFYLWRYEPNLNAWFACHLRWIISMSWICLVSGKLTRGHMIQYNNKESPNKTVSPCHPWRKYVSCVYCEVICPADTMYTIITSLLRQNDVATSFWRNNDVIIPSHVRWAVKTVHYYDVIMSPTASQITSLTIVYSIVYRAQIKENIKAPRHWPLCGEFTGDRWIPRTNGQ